jgi:hypothetical protein
VNTVHRLSYRVQLDLNFSCGISAASVVVIWSRVDFSGIRCEVYVCESEHDEGMNQLPDVCILSHNFAMIHRMENNLACAFIVQRPSLVVNFTLEDNRFRFLRLLMFVCFKPRNQSTSQSSRHTHPVFVVGLL